MSTQLGSLRRFLATAAPRRGGDAHEGAILVASGKGGSGTSTLAALLALVAAAEGRRTLLIDADRGLATLHLLLGCEEGPGLGALREGRAPLDLVVPVAANLELLSCAPPPERAEEAPTVAEWPALYRRVLGCYGDFDLVVVDGGSRLDSLRGAGVLGAGRLLAVSAVDRISLAATHALIKACTAQHPGLRTGVAINRSGEAEARVAFEVLREGVGRFLARKLDFGGAIPDDPVFRQAIDEGATAQVAATRGALADAVRDLAIRAIPRGAPDAPAHVATR
jgi:flagellar biosynthesis protein FlhG